MKKEFFYCDWLTKYLYSMKFWKTLCIIFCILCLVSCGLFASMYRAELKTANKATYSYLNLVADSLYDAEGASVDLDIEQMENLKVIVTEESICVQTNSKIRYVSDNVTVLDKKLAKAMEAGKKYPAFILYK